MKQAIRDFPKQLKLKPVIENKENLVSKNKYLVSGMGGSHLAADLIKLLNPSLDLIVHHDYGLPEAKDRLVIISSYSGDTEEAIDGFKLALKKNLPLAAVSIGGELLKLAKKHQKPYIQIPDTGIEPRSALGFSAVCILKLMNKEVEKGICFDMERLEKEGKDLAERLKGHIPVIYTSTRNEALGYNWKIRFNETGKVPCFNNTFPELNHNEMVGFDREGKSRGLSDNFYFIFLRDKEDHKRNLLRMDVLKDIYEEKGLKVQMLDLEGKGWQKIFSSLLLADWAAFYTAQIYGLEDEETEIITRFKNIIKKQ